jgi:hypothetical protein
METLDMTKFRWFPVIVAALAVAAIGCGKGDSPAAADPSQAGNASVQEEGASKQADESGGQPRQPNAVVGATRTELLNLVRTTLADKAEYKVDVGVPDNATSGSEWAFELQVTPKQGWKLNKEFPTRLLVKPPSDVKIAKPQQAIADAVEFAEASGAAWHVRFTPDSAGSKQVNGEFEFAVCTETTCVPKRETLSIALSVK